MYVLHSIVPLFNFFIKTMCIFPSHSPKTGINLSLHTCFVWTNHYETIVIVSKTKKSSWKITAFSGISKKLSAWSTPNPQMFYAAILYTKETNFVCQHIQNRYVNDILPDRLIIIVDVIYTGWLTIPKEGRSLKPRVLLFKQGG